MSFATRVWARRLVNAASTTPAARTSLLRPRAMPLKAYKPFRTMATAANHSHEFVGDVPVTTITEDARDFGGKHPKEIRTQKHVEIKPHILSCRR